MIIYSDYIKIECDEIEPRKSGKMTYYYANGQKINNNMIIEFVCSCGERVTKTVKEYKRDSRLLCKKCKTIQTNMDKYGVVNLLHSEKAKQTNIERYGYDNHMKSDKYRKLSSEKSKKAAKKALDKRKKTNMSKFGVEYSFQSESVKDKIRKTNLKKYGGHPMLNDIVKDKIVKKHYSKSYERILKRTDIKPLFNLKDYFGTDSNQEYEWLCRRCNNTFKSRIYTSYIKKCPVCYPNTYGTSNIEKEIFDFIKSLGINNIIKNSKSIIKPYELDIFLPDYKLAIELNGLYWHGELMGRDKYYHLNKTLECEKNNIFLIHIFEDEWIEKEKIVKNIIKQKLGVVENILYARKCELREIENQKSFLEENHIQGYVSSKINIGLFYNNELVSLLTFNKPRYNKKYDWEIIRFVNKFGYSIVGGFSKMLKYFQKNYPGSIITYSDRRYFDGKIYEINNFNKLSPSKPNFYYTDQRQHRFSRIEFQKHKLEEKLEHFDSELTEWENMQMNGWDRIWDCGNNVFEML